MQLRKPFSTRLLRSSSSLSALLLAVFFFGAQAGADVTCDFLALCPEEGTTCLIEECRRLVCLYDELGGELVWQHDRFLPLGTACGDQSAAQCSGPDGCDGLGSCIPNDFIGTACGPPGEVCGLGQCLPSTLVTSTADKNDLVPGDGACEAGEGECTLRAALQETNATAGAEAVLLPAGTFQLTIAVSLLVGDELLLLGAGDDATSIDASGVEAFEAPLLVVEPDAFEGGMSAAISGVTFRDGVVIDDFGIANFGALTFADSAVSNFESTGTIFNAGTLRMERGSVTGNQGYYAGGLITTEGSLAKLTESEVSGNRSFEFGGILNASSELMLLNSTVSGNQPAAIAAEDFSGGGIDNLYGITTLVESTVSENQAVYGGGIENYFGFLLMIDSTVSGNSAYVGGGISFEGGLMTITNSTISGNQATYGGGIFGEGGPDYGYGYGYVTNSTISGNTAYYGGGAASEGENYLIFYNSSVVGNHALASDGGGGFADADPGIGVIAMVSTILAKNTAGEGSEETRSNCLGDIASGPRNLVDDESCPDTEEDLLVVDDALLGPLADNGGPTETHLPLPGSPAIDAGANDFCPAADQRGETRPQNPNEPSDPEAICDIGSVEVVPEPGGLLLLGTALTSVAAIRRLRACA